MLCARVIRGMISSAQQRHVALGKFLGGLRIGERIAEPDHYLTRAEQRQIGLAGFGVCAERADLNEAVGGKGVGAGCRNLCTRLDVLAVWETCRFARSTLDDHVQAGFYERCDGRGNQRNSALAGEGFAKDGQ